MTCRHCNTPKLYYWCNSCAN